MRLPRSEPELLAAARDGDPDAFAALVEPLRSELHAHAYRMLGSLHDADDALQDALLRAWRGLPGYEGRSSVRTWLHRVTVNASLDVVARRPVRVLPADLQDGTQEIAWLDPYPTAGLDLVEDVDAPHTRYAQHETLELAFVAALQHLPARQRAVLVLRDCLRLSAKETADALGTSVAAVTSALQRARATLDERRPQASQQTALAQLGDAEVTALVGRWTAALEAGDVDAVIALMGGRPQWSMPPQPEWYEGVEAVRGFFVDGPGRQEWRHRAVRANNQLAVGCYLRADDGVFRFWVLDVLTLEAGRVAAVTAFIDSSLAARFGLPATLQQ